MSEKFEEYIEVIFEIIQRTGEDHAHTNEIADKLGLRPASVTEMLNKLSNEGLVDYKAYYGAGLTAKGKHIAHELKRRHDTFARFLIMIGVHEEDADREACQLEHHIDPSTADRLVKFVDYLETGQGKRFMADFS